MGRFRRFGLENNFQPRIKGMGDATKHAEGVAFVRGRLKTADVLLRSFEFAGQLLLREPGLFAESSKLQGYIPCLARLFETIGEFRVAELFLQENIKVGLLHRVFLSNHASVLARCRDHAPEWLGPYCEFRARQ